VIPSKKAFLFKDNTLDSKKSKMNMKKGGKAYCKKLQRRVVNRHPPELDVLIMRICVELLGRGVKIDVRLKI
jgi:hypothetical protein